MPATATKPTATKERETREGKQPAREKLSYTHQREFAEHVEDAKRPETRQRRIEKSIRLLAPGKKEPR